MKTLNMKNTYYFLILGAIVAIPLTTQLISSFDATDSRTFWAMPLVIISFIGLLILAYKGENNEH